MQSHIFYYLRMLAGRSVLWLLCFLLTFASPAIIPSAHAETGLVAHWTFDETSGTTAADTSGNSNDLSITGSPSWVSGKISGALSFNGASYGHLATFTNTPASTMTLCSWLKTSSHTDQVIIQYGRNPSGFSNEGMFKINANGTLQYWDWSGGLGFSTTATSQRSVADGNWHLACFVKNGLMGTYYIDGMTSGTNTASQDIAYNTADWTVGGDYRDHNAYFNGLLDDVRVYNIALNPEDISGLYGMIGYWKYDDGSGTTAIDSSGYNDPATLSGGPVWVAGKKNGALHFNNNYDYVLDAPILNPTSAITIAAWIRTTTTATHEAFIAKSLGSNSAWYFEVDPIDCGVGKLRVVMNIGGSDHPLCSSNPITANTWYHVAATYNDSTQTIYINGVADASQSVSGALAVSTQPIITGDWNAGTRSWAGDVDDVALYGRGLLAEEVASLAAVSPDPVTNLQVTGGYLPGFDASWDANAASNNVTDYLLQYSSDGGSTWSTIDTASTATTYTLTGVPPGTYSFRVAAVNSIGQGGYSNTVQISSPVLSYVLDGDCAKLENISVNPGDAFGNYRMSSSIDCSPIANFVPIDFGSNGFQGTFNGQNNTISHLTMDTNGASGGLFKSATTATFENLTLSDGSISGGYLTGGVVGSATGTAFSHINSSLSITSSYEESGGLVGNLRNNAGQTSSITDSSVTGGVTGDEFATGGLIGELDNHSGTVLISKSYVSGNVSSLDYPESVGGLIGLVQSIPDGGANATITIQDIYTTGSISASGGYYAGGLIGDLEESPGSPFTNSVTISRGYSSGAITGDYYVGGLIGYADSLGTDEHYTISDLFASGSVQSTLDATSGGGLIGYYNADPSFVTATNNYFDQPGTGQTLCSGTIALAMPGCAAIDTSSNPNYFKNTTTNSPMNDWDFSSTWESQANGYPIFSTTPIAIIVPLPTFTPVIPAAIEDAGPNNGDANADTIRDSQEANVASYLNHVSNQYTTLEVPASCTIKSVISKSDATNAVRDAGYTYPMGMMNFNIACGSPGYTATITQYYFNPDPSKTYTMRKFSSSNNGYSTLTAATYRIVTIGGVRAIKVSYIVKDGGPNDADGQANGVIVDPAGLGVVSVGIPNTGLGGGK